MWERVIGNLASAGSVAVWLTCVPVCWRIVKKGSSTDVSFFPFVIMFCSATLWLKYGLFKNDVTLIYVNGIGSVLTLIYLIIYYIHTSTKTLIHKQLAFGSVLLFPILLYLRYYADDRADATFYMGLFCSCVSVLSYGSPLAGVADVLRTRSTHCMTFGLSFGNFIVALEWVLYGYMVDDLFVQIPNSLGALLGLMQLGLFAKYPARSNTARSNPATSEGHKVDRI